MHQIRFWLGLRPRSRWGSLQRSSRPPSWIKGVLLLREREGNGEGKGGEGRQGEGRAGEGGKGGKGRGGEGRGGRKEKEGKGRREEALLVMWPTKLSALSPPLSTMENFELKLLSIYKRKLMIATDFTLYSNTLVKSIGLAKIKSRISN